MKITLNKDEIKAAIALYVREKCISNNGYGREISQIYLTIEDDEAIVTADVNAIEQVDIAPSPCAPACPPRAY